MGANPNEQNELGNTILHDLKDNDVIQQFFKQKGDPNIQNNKGNTALHSSIDCVWSVTKALLNNNADVNIRNAENNTPIVHAGIGSRTRMGEMIEHLQIDLTSGKGRKLFKEISTHPQVTQLNKDWIVKEQENQKKTKQAKLDEAGSSKEPKEKREHRQSKSGESSKRTKRETSKRSVKKESSDITLTDTPIDDAS